ncbi:MAG: elongation factor P [Bdellovibrionales bacterium]
MIQTSDFKKGLKLLLDGEPYNIVDFQHTKPGKGNAFTKAKMKNLITGNNLERTFKSGEKFEMPDVEFKSVNFLYSDESGFHFMDQVNYEQVALQEEDLAPKHLYLKENDEVTMLFFNERAIGIELPNTVTLVVAQTDPGFKGNTVTNTFKPATMETGCVVQVPLHTKIGDLLKIQTEDGKYLERVNLK